MAKETNFSLGRIAFIVGLIIAVLVAIFAANAPPTWAIILLAILGIVVGLFNVTGEEVRGFLLAAIAFLISFQALSNVFTTITLGWGAVGAFFDLLSVFVAPAAAVVAIIALFRITQD